MLVVGAPIKSRHSIADCVTVALQPDGSVEVTDSKDPSKAALVYTQEEWVAFVLGVKDGEFDHPAQKVLAGSNV